jgi:hypothetical protein
LLARDRREDPDLRRRERIREVVLERRDLRDLRAGRELQLVAGDARAGDLADDVRVDAEVRERLDEQLGDARRGLPRRLVPRRRDVEDAGVRELVLDVLARDLVEERRRVLDELRVLGVQERRRRSSPTTSGYASRPSTGGAWRSAGRDGAGSGQRSGSGAVRGRRLRALVAARRKVLPERRRIAPSEAPERSSEPTRRSRIPRIVEPVAPIATPTAPPRSWPK